MITRRSFLKSSGALVAAGSVRVRAAQAQHIVVVGAGVFGGWTALSLLRKGARVTLVDAWGPGNARASSGGETQVIRASYGGQKMYVELVARALELWRDNEKRWNKKLFFQCGSLRLRKDASYAKSAVPLLKGAGLPIEELTPSEAGKRFPQINMDGVGWALYEHDAGYLLARRACQAVLESFIAEGGNYRQLAVKPTDLEVGLPEGLFLSDGTYQLADQYVFACGPWLGKLFPETIGARIRPNRQEVFFFGTAAGDPRFGESQMPCFLDGAFSPGYYGIPGERVARVQSRRRDAERADLRPDGWQPQRHPRARRPGTSLHGSAFPGAERRATRRLQSVPIRELARWRFHRRPASESGPCLDRRWRLGPRLQARPRFWRACGLPSAGRAQQGRALLVEPIRVGSAASARGCAVNHILGVNPQLDNTLGWFALVFLPLNPHAVRHRFFAGPALRSSHNSEFDHRDEVVPCMEISLRLAYPICYRRSAASEETASCR